MRKNSILFAFISLALLTLVFSACSAQAAPASGQVQAQEAFTDPFSYCASIGTIDKPDARYSGAQIPDVVVKGYLKAAGLEGSSEPMDMLKKTTIWRCMDQKVYACNFGANLPCDSKANTNKQPTQAMGDFCKENQDAEFIPMSVTGHETVYSWHCVKGTAEVLKQESQVDAAGYLSQIWYPIEPVK